MAVFRTLLECLAGNLLMWMGQQHNYQHYCWHYYYYGDPSKEVNRKTSCCTSFGDTGRHSSTTSVCVYKYLQLSSAPQQCSQLYLTIKYIINIISINYTMTQVRS